MAQEQTTKGEFTVKIHKFLLILFFMFLAGCGEESSSTTTPTNPDGTIPNVAAIELTVASSTIATGGATGVTVRLYTASGQLVTDSKTVTFTLSPPTLATITPFATTSSGVLTQTLTAKTVQGSVTLTASVDGLSAEQTVQISNLISAATITATANPAAITVGGTSVISATVLDNTGTALPDGTTVNFSVNNTSLGTIVPLASVSGGAGVAQATFSAGTTTAGTATITATSGSASGTVDIGVAGAAAGSIEFLSATPQIVVIKGAGGIETSLIEFQVNDSLGNPVVGSQTVRLVLSGPNGGEYIGPTPGMTTLDVGTVAGIASTTLHSGTIPGTATINATVVGTTLTTSSGVIAIGGGVPSEGHFSLSTSVLNLEGWAYDGITADITARISDRYGNYNVLEGTSVSFYSECGAIDRAVNLSAVGDGTVQFRTQRPAPQDVALTTLDTALKPIYDTRLGVTIDDSNNFSGGLCTIIAVIDGEEEFNDANASGTYNLGESFVDTYDDIHLDKDDDSETVPFGTEVAGIPYDSTFEDLIVDRNLNGVFNGMNNVWDANKRIARQIKLLFTGIPGISIAVDGAPSTAITSGDQIIIANGGSKKINFSLHDANFNPPIAGTTFTVTADIGSVAGTTSDTFLDTASPGSPIYSLTILDDDPADGDPVPAIGNLTFKWTWKGAEYTYSVPLSVD